VRGSNAAGTRVRRETVDYRPTCLARWQAHRSVPCWSGASDVSPLLAALLPSRPAAPRHPRAEYVLEVSNGICKRRRITLGHHGAMGMIIEGWDSRRPEALNGSFWKPADSGGRLLGPRILVASTGTPSCAAMASSGTRRGIVARRGASCLAASGVGVVVPDVTERTGARRSRRAALRGMQAPRSRPASEEPSRAAMPLAWPLPQPSAAWRFPGHGVVVRLSGSAARITRTSSARRRGLGRAASVLRGFCARARSDVRLQRGVHGTDMLGYFGLRRRGRR
jgi:hypothetical protein